MININARILAFLSANGLSITYLSKKTGISKQNLTRILNSSDIKISQLFLITKAIDKPITFFFTGNEYVSDSEYSSLLCRLKDLEEILNDKRIIIDNLRKQIKTN